MEDALLTGTGKPKIPPGAKGSVRVDVLEDAGDKTICVYDIKTGRRGLSFPRMVELADHVADHYGADYQIIVTEVRPTY